MARKPKQQKVTDQLRRLIDSCGISRYELAKRTGVSESALSRFMAGERGLSAKALDKVGECLGWEVVTRGPKRS